MALPINIEDLQGGLVVEGNQAAFFIFLPNYLVVSEKTLTFAPVLTI